MRVVGVCGYSGAGKTTLIEALIGRFKAAGCSVSVVKHAHHRFDIDHPGKDSWRHRQAGAFEVVVASSHRLAKVREYAQPHPPSVHELLAELAPCDWAFVEGFRHADLPKVEVWRAVTGEPAHYPHDAHIVAVVTDRPQDLPMPTTLPVFSFDETAQLTDFLLNNASRHEHPPPLDDVDA